MSLKSRIVELLPSNFSCLLLRLLLQDRDDEKTYEVQYYVIRVVMEIRSVNAVGPPYCRYNTYYLPYTGSAISFYPL